MTENTSPPDAVVASEARQFMPDDEISLLDLLQVVADNLRLLVLGPLLAGLLALAYSFTIPPTYTATTKFIPPQQQQSGAAAMLANLGALGGLVGAAGIKSPTDQYVAFLKSNSLQDALVDRFKLIERSETKSREDARRAISGSVQITSGRDGLITIETSGQDPVFAAQLANAHVEELGKLLNSLAITEAQQRRLFFEKQLVKAKDNLVKAEQALATSGVKSSILKSTGAAVAAVGQLNGQISAQEVKLANMRGYLADSSPELKQAQTELFVLRAQMRRLEMAEPAMPPASSDSDYIAKLRDFKYFETLFDLFTKQYDVARIDESREGMVIQVLDAAHPPERKSQPKKAQIAMLTTLAVGFALLLFIFFRQALRSAWRNQESAVKLADLNASFKKALGQGRR